MTLTMETQLFLLSVAPIVGLCVCSVFSYALLCVFSSFGTILMGYSVGSCVEIRAPLCIWRKSDSYRFKLKKYIAIKEKDVSNFSCSINVTVTSLSSVPSFHMDKTAYI